jgi:hypothetical protein
MKNSNEFAALWREKIEATVEREFGGVRGVFRRLNLMEWIRLKKLPQFLVEKMLRAIDGQPVEVSEAGLSQEEFEQTLDARRDIVCAVTVFPKIVKEERELKEGEIAFSELAERCPEVITGIASWVFAGCPDIPVQTKGGETTVEELSNFRPGGADGAASSTGDDVQAVQPAPEPISGD